MPADLHPTVAAFLRALADHVRRQADAALIAAFRAMIDRVVVYDADGGGMQIEVHGPISGLSAFGDGVATGSPFATSSPCFLWGRFAA